MQNKRGISQAFSPPPLETGGDIGIRAATVFDVFELSNLLQASIRDLCVADHNNDAEIVERWTAHKTPQDIRGWITAGQCPLIAEVSGRIGGLGLTTADGRIELLYVAPFAVGKKLGHALLCALEDELRQKGHSVSHLTATRTALKFYKSHGWEIDGPCQSCFGLPGQPMRKLLQPVG